jgi:hypothetical protein
VRGFDVAAAILVVLGELALHHASGDGLGEAQHSREGALRSEGHSAPFVRGPEDPGAIDRVRPLDDVHPQPVWTVELGELDDLLELLAPRRLGPFAPDSPAVAGPR